MNLVTISTLLSFNSGWINAACFIATARFVSHLTGFGTLIGVELSLMAWDHVLAMSLVPGFFLLGVIAATYLANRMANATKSSVLLLAFVSLALASTSLLGAAGWFGVFGYPMVVRHDFTLLAILCLACGIMNGLVTHLSVGVYRVSHLTGLTTDLGIFMAKFLAGKVSRPDQHMFQARLLILLGFISGAIAGAFSSQKFGYATFWAPSLLVALTGLTLIFKGRPD